MRRNEAMHPCPRPLSALVLVTLRLQWLGKLAKTFMIFIFIRLIELAVESTASFFLGEWYIE